jgi:hypothetical protein
MIECQVETAINAGDAFSFRVRAAQRGTAQLPTQDWRGIEEGLLFCSDSVEGLLGMLLKMVRRPIKAKMRAIVSTTRRRSKSRSSLLVSTKKHLQGYSSLH